jgi:hypothetical protein
LKKQKDTVTPGRPTGQRPAPLPRAARASNRRTRQRRLLAPVSAAGASACLVPLLEPHPVPFAIRAERPHHLYFFPTAGAPLAPLCSSPRDTGKPSLLVVSFQSSSSLPCVILPQTLPCKQPPHPTARAPPPAPLPSPPGVPPRPTGSGECPRSQDFEMELPTTPRRLAAPGCPPCRRQSWHGRAAVLWPPWPQLAAPLGEDSGPGRVAR